MGKQIEGVHVLRAIAATMVVVCHAQLTLFRSETSGAAGVDIFFVISGFVMALTTAAPPANDFAGWTRQSVSFIRKRIQRIVPLYWIVLLFTGRRAFSAALIKDFFFIPRLNPAIPGMIKPVLTQGWTLNFEMMFYMVFATGMLFGRNRFWVLALGLITLPLLTALGANGVAATFYSDTIVLEFGFGVVLYHLVQCGFPQWPRLTYLLLLAVGFVLLVDGWNAGPRFIVSGLPAFLIVWSSFRACEGWLRSKTLTLLGDASYAIYLVHWTSFGPLKHLHIPVPAAMAVYVVTGLCAGIAVHLLVEKPLTSWLGRKIKPKPASVVVAPVAVNA